MAIYNTPQELRDMALIADVFALNGGRVEAVNPNCADINARCDALRAEVDAHNERPCRRDVCLGKPRHTHPRDAGGEVMERIFKPLVASCDVLVFRALPDGTIPAGVFKEMTWAQANGTPILELPSATSRRELTVAETKQYLKEIGQR